MLEKTEGAIKNGQSRDTGSIGHTRHITKVNKKKTQQQHKKQAITHQKTKKRSNTDPIKNREGTQVLAMSYTTFLFDFLR
jgi:hypothetical protein